MTKLVEVRTVPRGTFQGSNFMTPERHGYYRGTLKGRTVYVELSRGRGFFGGIIGGLTVKYAGGETPEPDLSHGGFPWSQWEEELGKLGELMDS